MECKVCGRSADADRETGYNADGVCPACARDGWIELADGSIEREIEAPAIVVYKDTGSETTSKVVGVFDIDDEAETECPF